MDSDIKPVNPQDPNFPQQPLAPNASQNPTNTQLYNSGAQNVQVQYGAQQQMNPPAYMPQQPQQQPQVQAQPQTAQVSMPQPNTPQQVPQFTGQKKSSKGFRLPKIPRGLKGFIGTVELILGAVLLAFVINAFVFQSYEVVGESMYPTLHNGDRLIISKIGKSWSNIWGDAYVPERGDIIVFRSPNGEQRQLIKRVIAFPGEKVVVENGTITIYNDEHPEGFDPDIPYKDSLPPDTSNHKSTDVPDGHIFVSGDNRTGGSSLDSRNELGTVPLENIVGKLALRILPFDSAQFY